MAENEPDTEHTQDSSLYIQAKKVYVKDVSFETPNSPEIFTRDWKPSLNLDLAQKIAELPDNHFEVVLSLTATVKVDDMTAYLVEAQQAGIFLVKDMDPQQLHRVLNVVCPRLLFPYASFVISDLVTRGGFPQLVLSPVDFKLLYEQRLAKAAAEQQAATP